MELTFLQGGTAWAGSSSGKRQRSQHTVGTWRKTELGQRAMQQKATFSSLFSAAVISPMTHKQPGSERHGRAWLLNTVQNWSQGEVGLPTVATPRGCPQGARLSSLSPVAPDHTCMSLSTIHLGAQTGVGPRRKRSSSYKVKF